MNILLKFITSATMLGLLSSPISPAQMVPVLKTASVSAGEIASPVLKADLADKFLGDIPSSEKTSIVDKQMTFVSTREAYPASLAVVEKHEDTIKRTAREKSVPEEVAIGVALLENGGSETAVSSAGAAGVFQLMPATGRSLGLTVNKSVDERMNPAKNIEAGIRYLKSNFELFGDWGLATWAYHAGEGNVAKALKIYAKENHGVNIAGVGDRETIRNFVEKYGVTIHMLLSDSAVKAFTKKLNDDSAGYPYKVLATSALFEEASR